MNFEFRRLALIGGLSAAVSVAALAGQHATTNSNPPANPQAKITQPATHFTQGTITSIQANQLIISRTVRGKAAQMAFALTSQTERTGTLVAGARVSVNYRENNNQNIAAAVRELPADTAEKSGKATLKPKSKS